MLLQSFFPLVVLILAVLGSIVFGLATPTEAAAVGAFGGYLLAAVYATVAKRKDKARVFVVWLLLWAPALISIGWFFLHRGGSVEAPVPVAFGTLAVLGVALWAMLAYKQAWAADRGEGIGLPHRQDQRDGVLAVRGQRDLLGRLCAAGRAGAGRALGHEHEPQQDRVPGAEPGDHLHPRLAAGVDRDHRDLHAHLHPAAGQLRRRPAVLSACSWR